MRWVNVVIRLIERLSHFDLTQSQVMNIFFEIAAAGVTVAYFWVYSKEGLYGLLLAVFTIIALAWCFYVAGVPRRTRRVRTDVGSGER
jgi:membrane-bound metal-dependent hydrolase YbcI (DUF457 family)